MVFCNLKDILLSITVHIVTILILIDGFLQLGLTLLVKKTSIRHNPYFNRWFSAILADANFTEFKGKSQSLF